MHITYTNNRVTRGSFVVKLVVVLYPSEEKEIGEQYTVIRNNICDRSSTKVIHIIQKNAYVAEAGKYITELVDGPVLQAKVMFA